MTLLEKAEQRHVESKREVPPPDEKRELFVIGPKALMAVTPEEVKSTIAGLKELNLYSLPYDEVDIQIPVRINSDECSDEQTAFFWCTKKPNSSIRMVGCRSDKSWKGIFTEYPNGELWKQKNDQYVGRFVGEIIEILVALLATKNALKTTRESKLAKLGIGKKRKAFNKLYSRVTTITVPDDLPSDKEHPPTGRTVCPHLRRGHIRWQHYGPQWAFMKKIWIEPVLVNADESFVSNRQAYNLSFRGKQI
jgi:hypothetical protein